MRGWRSCEGGERGRHGEEKSSVVRRPSSVVRRLSSVVCRPLINFAQSASTARASAREAYATLDCRLQIADCHWFAFGVSRRAWATAMGARTYIHLGCRGSAPPGIPKGEQPFGAARAGHPAGVTEGKRQKAKSKRQKAQSNAQPTS